MRPLTLGVLVLVFAAGVGTGSPQLSKKVPESPSETHQIEQHTPAVLTALRSDELMEHRRVTSALMTGHLLTSAQLVSRRDVMQVSVKSKDNSKQDN